MTKYFASKSYKGFFISDVNKSMPDDVVEIDKSVYNSLMDGQYNGKVIDFSGDIPVLKTPELVPEIAISIEMAWIESELNYIRDELEKVQDSDPSASGSVSEWRSYRKLVRAWKDNPNFPNKDFRPTTLLN